MREMTPRRRKVLRLRAAGWSYKQIAERVGISEHAVKRDLMVIQNLTIPGLTNGDEPMKGYRIVYALGLLDAGANAGDVPRYMRKLVEIEGERQ